MATKDHGVSLSIVIRFLRIMAAASVWLQGYDGHVISLRATRDHATSLIMPGTHMP